jgi:hypothetical protein
MVALQAAQVAGPPAPADLTLKKPLPAALRCGEPDESGDIVICARGKEANRLPKLPDRYVRVPARAETRIFGNARLSVEAEQGSLPSGQSSPRAMVRLKLPF